MASTVLIIEDNEQNLYLVRYLMTSHGWEVREARDGRRGIASAREAPPDLILVDIQLPVMDGYAVARELRRDPVLACVPVVAVTSYAMPGDREKALAAGCDGYLEKPIDPDTFMEAILGFTGGAPAARGGAE